jgi:branched-chain amino acid transport system ATP-binding protein
VRFWVDRDADQFIHDKVVGMLTAVGLLEMAWEKAGALSYGQQRELQIAVALATEPDLLLLDEPTSGVSPQEAGRLVALIRNLARQISLLIVEHDLDAVRDLDFPIYVLNEGVVVAHGRPDEVLRSEAVVRAFLGS